MDRFIKIDEVAAIMSMSKRKAKETLLKHGIYPVDYGRGRANGYRWLESVIQALIKDMYEKAQLRKTKKVEPTQPKLELRLHQMSSAEVAALLTQPRVLQ